MSRGAEPVRGTFRIAEVVHVADRSAMLLRGEVLSGEVRAGMFAALPWDEELDLVVPVAAVEAAPGEQVGLVQLMVRYANDLERILWQRLRLQGAAIDLSDEPPSD